MKTCTNKDCEETRPEEFHKIACTGRLQSQCRSCLSKKAKTRYRKPKVRVVKKTDSKLANDYTMMRW